MKFNKLNAMKIKIGKLMVFLVIILISSCGGGTSGPTVVDEETLRARTWWETETPDFSENEDRPIITLTGNNTVFLNIGDIYEEQGATASDLQDGELTSNISIDNQVNTEKLGDYFVRYTVADSSGLDAIETVRIIRVFDDEPVPLSLRPVGSTLSHMGYIEHLPITYDKNSARKFPLLIFNHGSGSNASLLRGTPDGALVSIISNGGPPLLINAGKWVEDDNFIVLSPQIGDIQLNNPVERLNAFIEFAVATYNIDESRIYVSGWSQGGFLSFEYARAYPEKVAAIVPISGGLVGTENLAPDFCKIEDVPIWAFHGGIDDVVPVESSIESIQAINTNCFPPIAPRLTVYLLQTHIVHHATFNLSFMENNSFGVIADPAFDKFNINLFDWLLSHSLETRNTP